jgi:oxygen-independent coproporphyrinogen-3 oxidase
MILPPLSLYVHIPWCVRKCPYCDFNSHEARDIPEADYVAALLRDLDEDHHLTQGRKLRSIFFGGGTPSLFKARSIGKILARVEQQIGFASSAEITLETNPGTAEYDNLEGYRSAGINRISFGIQSFNDQHLERLGRIHDSREAEQAYGNARRAGFENINLDLMHGLPDQTAEQARHDLQKAIDLQPEHISWYQLTIEPNTVFYNRPPVLPEDETLSDIQEAGQALLQQSGFLQYEVSAYGRPERQSQHNLNYWQFGDYLALGAGAHGKVSIPGKGILRYRKTRKPGDYLDPTKPFTAGSDYVAQNQQTLEFMMNALRLVNGVPRQWFAERTEVGDAALERYLPQLIERGLLAGHPDRLQPTSLGLRFLNDTLAVFDD